MKSTIRTEAGAVNIEAKPGRVESNGAVMLPHEAYLIGSELMRAAAAAEKAAAGYVSEQLAAAAS